MQLFGGKEELGLTKLFRGIGRIVNPVFFLSQFCCKDQGEQVFLVCAEAPAPCNLRIKLTAHKFRNLTLRPL